MTKKLKYSIEFIEEVADDINELDDSELGGIKKIIDKEIEWMLSKHIKIEDKSFNLLLELID
ncbi:hypothetical protein [Siminovitchia sp. 179-K 8D1 HS]|uniref:hypothetical protein n=1 Tax=Siminovitchia sp. 179-K 8D1 HS TaxID=3142385 RepID=UPI00399FD2A7